MSEQQGAPQANAYDAVFRRYCAFLEEDLREKLGRPLFEQERQHLWDIGSMMLLEAWERDVEAARTPAEVEKQMGVLETIARQRKEWRAKSPERQKPNV